MRLIALYSASRADRVASAVSWSPEQTVSNACAIECTMSSGKVGWDELGAVTRADDTTPAGQTPRNARALVVGVEDGCVALRVVITSHVGLPLCDWPTKAIGPLTWCKAKGLLKAHLYWSVMLWEWATCVFSVATHLSLEKMSLKGLPFQLTSSTASRCQGTSRVPRGPRRPI